MTSQDSPSIDVDFMEKGALEVSTPVMVGFGGGDFDNNIQRVVSHCHRSSEMSIDDNRAKIITRLLILVAVFVVIKLTIVA